MIFLVCYPLPEG